MPYIEPEQSMDVVPAENKPDKNDGLNDLDAEEVGKVVVKLQEEIQIIKLQLENLPGYDKGEVPEHLVNLKTELEVTFSSLERKNEMLINAMTKNFGKTHQDLPNFRLPPVSNTSKKTTLFALPPPEEIISDIVAEPFPRGKNAGILKPTASRPGVKQGSYKPKRSLGDVMKQRHMRDARVRA